MERWSGVDRAAEVSESEGQAQGRGPASTACLWKQGRGWVLWSAGLRGRGETEAQGI